VLSDGPLTAHTRDDAGFTLIEVLLAMTLMLIVFSATLGVFAVMERGAAGNQRLNESQQQARTATDALAKRLRNLASPSDTLVAADQQPLERAQAQDLVFRTVRSDGAPTASNPQNLERYRYCVGTDKVLWEQRMRWETTAMPAVPADTACPSAAWPADGNRAVAQNVVNGTRAVFAYQGSPVPGTYSELSAVDPENFPTAIALRSTLFLDPDVNRSPGEVTLTTRVFLRNQNRPPVAAFTVAASGKRITLNASGSDDPEGGALEYQWLDGGVPLTDPETGATLDFSQNAIHLFDAAAGSSSSHSFTLAVRDAGGLTATAPAQLVTCQGTPQTPTTCTKAS